MQKTKNILLILWRNPQYSMPIIILFWGVLYFFYGAVIKGYNGLGYDGATYGSIIKNFYDIVLNHKLNSYQIQRIFPLFLIDLVLTIFKIPKEDYIIVKVFQIYNLILLLLCSFIWYKISKIFKLNLTFTWLGFVLGFINFGIAGMTFYYPVLIDTMAFFLGFCLLYFHLKDNLIGKVIVIIIGAFSWPSFIYIGILMIIFPRKLNLDFKFNNDNKKIFLNIYLAFLLPVPFFIVSVYYINIYFSTGELREIFTPVFDRFLYIDTVLNYLLMLYFLFIFLPKGLSFSNCYLFIKKVLQNIKVKNILLSFIIFTIIFIIQKNLSNDQDTGVSFGTVIYNISLYGISKPFAYFVTSVTYFGPCFIILFFFLKYFKHHLKNLGIGVYLSFLITFFLIFITEPRVIINFFPFIILLTVLVIKNFNLKNNIFLWVTIFSFILSKVYIPMFNKPGGFFNYFTFDNQLYHMNTYLISKLSYYIQAIFILLISIYLVLNIKRNKVIVANSNNI